MLFNTKKQVLANAIGSNLQNLQRDARDIFNKFNNFKYPGKVKADRLEEMTMVSYDVAIQLRRLENMINHAGEQL